MSAQSAPESQELFHLMVESATDYAIFSLDRERRVTSWNTGAERIFGYTEAEIVGQSADLIITPEDRERGEPQREAQKALAAGRAEDDRWHVRKDGTRFYASGVLTPLGEGAARGFVKVLRELTERKRAEDTLRSSEQLLHHLIRNIPGGSINVLDRDLRYLFAAGQGLAQVGLTSEQLVGKTLSELFAPEAIAYVTPYYRRALAGETLDFELEVGGRWYIINTAPLDNAQGQINAVIALAQDITARKQAEEELRRAHDELEVRVQERTRELQETTAVLQAEAKERRAAEGRIRELLRRVVHTQENERRRISRDLHDQLGQQLTALRLSLESLRAQCGERVELCRQIEGTLESVQKIDANVDFLAWELRPVSLDELGLGAALDTFVREWSKHFGIAAEFHTTGFSSERLTPEIEINLYRITQEALQNVYKHAGADRVDVLLERRDDQAVLIIEDNGKGYDPEEEAAAGSHKGLGVINMQERAALVGGTLEVESTPGAGTTLYVRVPVGSAAGQ